LLVSKVVTTKVFFAKKRSNLNSRILETDRKVRNIRAAPAIFEATGFLVNGTLSRQYDPRRLDPMWRQAIHITAWLLFTSVLR
jgi:hypothetical protein